MSSNELDLLLKDGGTAMPLSLPSIVANRIENTLHTLPDRRAIESRTKRIRRLALMAASITIVGGTLASYFLFSRDQQSDIASLPQHNRLDYQSELIGTPMMGSLLEDSVVNKDGPSVTDQGITLMIRDVTYDGYEVAIRYSVKSDKEIDGFSMDASLAMDTKEIGRVGYATSDEPGNLNHRYEKYDSNQYEGVMGTWKLAYSDYLPRSFHLKVNATSIGGQVGKWALDIPVTVTSDTTMIRPALLKTSKEGTLKVNRLILSRVSTQFSFNFEAGALGEQSWVGVEVTDDKGFHYGSHISRSADDLNYMDLLPVTDQAKTLIIRPFYDDFRNNKQVELEDHFHTLLVTQPTVEEPLILPIGEAGQLEITGIEYLADKTVVYTKQPNTSGAGFAIQDDKGNLIPIITLAIGGATEFKPFSRDTPVTFLTRPMYPRTYIPELEARIDLPQP
ncbi:DUF4179 domain-containing protein [Cohnella sp. WQ 127256]|uniref:DUF4179 domain-containing protein n=1 Tax=Cohnella sp. WQ 127256 TaxID=2938790 RepID=UPI0021188860|nr:DUF4179 domain-containing protein [Cohnella sp. WQ 127256]